MLADFSEDTTDDNWEATAVVSIAAGCPPCAAYVAPILRYVKHYGGATGQHGGNQIEFLDAVAKEFQCHATLGESFWTAISEATFASKESKHPRLRNSLILANLTSPKMEDGIANLISKNDVRSLTTKKKMNWRRT